MSTSQTVADRLLRHCYERGIRTAFGVHGANIEDVYAAAPAAGITAVVAKHEFAAGAMADGTVRMTGASSLVLTTSGGGAMNVLPALAESYDSRVPVLALIGSAPRPLVGRGAFQDMLSPPDTIDLLGALMSITGFCTVLDDAADIGVTMSMVFDTLDRGLPAAVVVPKDIQVQQVSASTELLRATTRADGGPDLIAPLASHLRAAACAGKPICLWLGDEASGLGSAALIDDLANRLGAAIVAAPGGMDVVDSADTAGVTGVMGHPSAHRVIAESEICISLGCRMTVTDRAGLDDVLAHTEVIHIGTQDPRFDRCTSIIVEDFGKALLQLYDRLAALSPVAATRPHVSREVLHPPVSRSSVLPDTRTIVETIDGELPGNARVLIDAGNVGATAVHHLRPLSTQRVAVALGMGGMGYAIAAGVGVAIATGGREGRVVVIAGDGAFFMHGMEFHTAVQHRAEITLIILNNNAFGMCITREALYFPESASVNRFQSTDIAAGLAAMFADISVRHPTSAEELRADCADLFAESGPNCIVVDCDPDEVPPFLPFLPKGRS